MTLLDSLGDREDSAVSKESFVKGLIYSWTVLNTDAHAKNYSLQLYPRRAVLAPLYDVSSLIPYVNSIGAKES